MKRFWQEVTVGADGGIALDGRPVRTPGRVPLVLPTPALAEAVAEEWRRVGETLDPRAMPLTGLANAAIDRVVPNPATFADGLGRYGENDLLYYRADSPDELVRRQQAAWDPPLAWACGRYDVHFKMGQGVMHVAQPVLTVERLRAALVSLPPFALAAMSPLVTLTGSVVLALALAESQLAPDAAWSAAHVDEDWQAEQWGEDTLAADARTARRREFDAANRFLALAA